ncbi:tetratricopeptide repeat protein [Bradyrhizobium sp. BRP22]|uniref:adenylate/guanylate cyclase domain-containing protein n=1 Tax=Bradyrhizobium sp. BRP22 TaxID=2793821 RepID=UPI00201C7092|nr:tetratricopeptide repeat protein [Bradyrhizobium sp. BRP22]MCA1457643.1 tetratricopeptide repeat protein [Bradyrhizobium sp. BRP22]
MAADVAGYSRLMHDDEEATHGRLTTLLADVIEPTVAEHGGRIVKNTGDGFLAEFPSAVQAVRAAVRFQSAIGDLQQNDAKGRPLLFRVGINIGDVIVEPHDIFGDGVNIAARLEGIGEPGGISISSSAYDQVRGKVDMAFEDMGPQALKNIAEPIRVWRAKLSDSEVPKEVPEQAVFAGAGGLLGQILGRLKLTGGALASVATVGAIGLFGYSNVWNTRTDVLPDGQKTQREAAARPDIAPRLSLVVLPFANLNNDPEQDYFADSITADLTTDLARMRNAFVIGRGTAFTYKNRQVDLKTLGKDLGIRWAVQGAVRRAGEQVRVNVSLTDVASGRDIWSDRFDSDRTNVAVLQDQITVRLARSLNIELIQAESRRSETDRSKNPDAMDFTMRGWAKSYEPRSKTTIAQARELFDNALRLDPDHVDAMIGKAWSLSPPINLLSGWPVSVVEDNKTATNLVDRALSKSPANAMAHVVKGDTLRFGNPEEALHQYDAALEINPNFPAAYAGKGDALILAGRAREALSVTQLALRLSPRDPSAVAWRWTLCHAHLHLHDYQEAIEECRRTLNMNSAYWFAFIGLVSAYGATGQFEQARLSLAEFNKIRPDFTIQWYRDFGYALTRNPQFRREFDDILDGLRKVGVREH